MKHFTTSLFIPGEAGETPGCQLLLRSLSGCLSKVARNVHHEMPAFLSHNKDAKRCIAIIPSTSEKALRAVMKQILSFAYGVDEGWYPYDHNKTQYWKRTCYAFLSVPNTAGTARILFQALYVICEELTIGVIDKGFGLFHLLQCASGEVPQPELSCAFGRRA